MKMLTGHPRAVLVSSHDTGTEDRPKTQPAANKRVRHSGTVVIISSEACDGD